MNKDWLKFFAFLNIGLATAQAVVQVEQAVGAGNGAAKLGMVVGTVTAAASAVPAIMADLNKNDIASIVNDVATATVNSLNAAGVFKTSS